MNKELTVKFEQFDERIKDTINKYVNMVKDSFIPIFFKSEDEIKEAIVNNINRVIFTTDTHDRECSYTFSHKIIRLSKYEYDQRYVAHELHHVLQTACAYNQLKEYRPEMPDEVIIEKINNYYLKHTNFFEGMAYFWENEFSKKYFKTVSIGGVFNDNNYRIIQWLFNKYGYKNVYGTDLAGIKDFYRVLVVGAVEDDRFLIKCIYIEIEAINNIDTYIENLKYKKEYAKNYKSVYAKHWGDEYTENYINKQISDLQSQRKMHIELLKCLTSGVQFE